MILSFLRLPGADTAKTGQKPCAALRIRPLARALAAATAALTAGCSLVETTLPERGFAMNVSAGNLREDVILLNIVRASHFEPMNFVALSKYNGAGTFEVGSQANKNDGLFYDILNKGIVAAGTTATTGFVKQSVTPNFKANTSANFDLAPLDNKEFYAGFLAQLELPTINLLVNAGLSRELVLHSIVGAARVTTDDGMTHLFQNHPSDDAWEGDRSAAAGAKCEQLSSSGIFHPPFSSDVWRGAHAQDCAYQKFLYFLQAAVQYGITTEARDVPNPLAASDKSQPKLIRKVVLCYDSAVASLYGKRVSPQGRCGSKSLKQGERTYGDIGPHVRRIEPILRSSYGVYQFYGRLLASKSATRVRLIDAQTPRLPTGDGRWAHLDHYAGRDGLFCPRNAYEWALLRAQCRRQQYQRDILHSERARLSEHDALCIADDADGATRAVS